jgi:hypothetical protein
MYESEALWPTYFKFCGRVCWNTVDNEIREHCIHEETKQNNTLFYSSFICTQTAVNILLKYYKCRPVVFQIQLQHISNIYLLFIYVYKNYCPSVDKYIIWVKLFSHFLRGIYNHVKILNNLVFHTVNVCKITPYGKFYYCTRV